MQHRDEVTLETSKYPQKWIRVENQIHVTTKRTQVAGKCRKGAITDRSGGSSDQLKSTRTCHTNKSPNGSFRSRRHFGMQRGWQMEPGANLSFNQPMLISIRLHYLPFVSWVSDFLWTGGEPQFEIGKRTANTYEVTAVWNVEPHVGHWILICKLSGMQQQCPSKSY